MEWAEVLSDPCLKNLPYKIELDHFGRIVMSPASNRHGRAQARLVRWLDRVVTEGEIVTECSVATADGVKVADVAWLSADFVARHGDATPFLQAPELCVEIISPASTPAEMAEKVRLNLDAGAQEVWLVGEDGDVTVQWPGGATRRRDFPDHASGNSVARKLCCIERADAGALARSGPRY